jgi:hypothetical protein
LAVSPWLLDTGPLVAYLDRSDPAHTQVATCLDAYTGPLCTTGAVVTEGMHLISADPSGPTLLAEFIESAGVIISQCTQSSHLKRAVALMRKYADTPMDFADATLVLLADELRVADILTLDRRGFTTYRTARGKPFRCVLDSDT